MCIRDSGNIVELIARHDQDNASTKLFNTDSILNISEIGLPTNNVIALGSVLKKHYNLKPYKSASAKFAPIGTNTTLFICVPVGRNWFPTNIPAQNHPVEVDLGIGKDISFEGGLYHFK